MQLIDSHCHIDFAAFDNDRTTILSNCHDSGMTDIIVPAVSAARWDSMLGLCSENSMLHPALGLHPYFMDEHQHDHIQLLNDYVDQHDVIAIGEIGLDFYIENHDRDAQIHLVTEQLKIAQKYDLPVIFHVRKAHDQMLQLLKKHPVKGGVIHAFSGSQQQAENYIKHGMLLGIGGVCTYPRANRLRKLVSDLPLTSFVLETDAPDMPLSGKQGQRNSPENIPIIAETIAKLRKQSISNIATATTENCRRLFNI